MSANRPMKKLFALVLTAATVALCTQLDGHVVAAGASSQPAGLTGEQGNRGVVPPILRRATPSELAAIASAEAEEAAARSYVLPDTARFSYADIHAYAGGGR
jgi:hypothetical protein